MLTQEKNHWQVNSSNLQENISWRINPDINYQSRPCYKRRVQHSYRNAILDVYNLRSYWPVLAQRPIHTPTWYSTMIMVNLSLQNPHCNPLFQFTKLLEHNRTHSSFTSIVRRPDAECCDNVCSVARVIKNERDVGKLLYFQFGLQEESEPGKFSYNWSTRCSIKN